MNRQSFERFFTGATALLASVVLCAAGSLATDNEVSTLDSTRTEVLNLTLKYMGLEGRTDLKPAIELMTVSPDSDPFRSEKYSGRRVWHVRIDSLVLRMDYKERLGLVQEPRPFDIFIDSASGRLLRIVSRNPKYSDSTVEKPGPIDTELLWTKSLGEADEPPAEVPAIGFVEALNRVKDSDAPEIVGLCRVPRLPDTPNPQPGWLIHYYGQSRRMTRGTDRYVSGPEGTHMRANVVPGEGIGFDWPRPLTPAQEE
jgi:hypothetical protein